MIKHVLLSGLLLSGTAAHATYQSWSENRQGVKALEKKDGFKAFQHFNKALEDDPLNWSVQMNLGMVFEANEEWEKAAAAYSGASRLSPEGSDKKFESLFNMAGALGKNQKIDEALAAYQAALEIKPDSLEVKNNIELLFQGGGGGGGKGKPDKDKKDQQQGNNQQQREDSLKNPQQDEKQKQQPKPFNSEDLSKDDVKRILDEIKNQEQSIRANEYQKGGKEAAKGKDW